MCPRRPVSESPSQLALLESPTYVNWVASARCVIALFRRHLTTRTLVCDDCYQTLTPRRISLHEHVIRHYIVLGDNPEFEDCAYCARVLVATVPVRNATCGVCPRILAGFLSYIARHELTPYNDPDATVVCIREFRV